MVSSFINVAGNEEMNIRKTFTKSHKTRNDARNE